MIKQMQSDLPQFELDKNFPIAPEMNNKFEIAKNF